MVNSLLAPSAIIGLMGQRRNQNSLLPFFQQQADPLDEMMAARAGQGYQEVSAPTPEYQFGQYAPVGSQQAQQTAPTGPAQRGRVNPLNVLFRGLAPNLSGALDTERARLQAEADRPQMLALQQENERIARALGPQALLALRTNSQALGEGLSAQYKPTTTGAGGVSTIFGTGQQVEAPRVLEFGNDLVQTGPISGTRTLATRGPSYAEQATMARVDRDAANDAARLDLDYRRLGQDQSQFDQRLGFDQSKIESRPLSAAQQRQVETYYQDLNSLEGVNGQVASYINMIDSGQLNFSPTANASARVRNALGVSSDNSRNQALFRSDMERLRNESLRLNSGVQTEGDAQRAWNELFGNLNDEKVVKAQLERIQQFNNRAIQLRQQRLRTIEGQQFGGPQGSNSPAPPPGFVLD